MKAARASTVGRLVLLCLAAVTMAAAAQQSTPNPSPDKAGTSIFAKVAAESSAQAEQQKQIVNALPADLLRKDTEDLAAYVKWQREFARQSWDWHLFSTKLLMYVVLTIVGFGLLITYLQFTRDGRRHIRATRIVGSVAPNAPIAAAASMTATAITTGPPAAATAVVPAAEKPASETVSASTVKIGPGGLEITSQVIGLLVLGFSLAFFYLYVKVVYPMQEVELQRQADSVSGSPPDSAPKSTKQ